MRTILTVAIAAAPLGASQCDSGPQSAADCLPTTGNNCSCEPQCMTKAEIRRIDSFCALACIDGEPNWECTVVDGACAVVE